MQNDERIAATVYRKISLVAVYSLLSQKNDKTRTCYMCMCCLQVALSISLSVSTAQGIAKSEREFRYLYTRVLRETQRYVIIPALQADWRAGAARRVHSTRGINIYIISRAQREREKESLRLSSATGINNNCTRN